MSTPELQDAARGDHHTLKIVDHLETAFQSAKDPGTANGGDLAVHRVKNLPGYTTPVFKGKDQQRAKVQADIMAKVRVA